MLGALEHHENVPAVASSKFARMAKEWFGAVLCACWARFNRSTAKQARRCKISAHFFG